MPIKDPTRYPDDWKERREAVLKRAGHRCECSGECGNLHPGGRCNAEDGSRGYWLRDSKGKGSPLFTWKLSDEKGSFPTSKIVLTTAHLDHDLVNHDLDNLKALCQRCHLTFDARARRAEEKKDQIDLID